MAGIGKGHRKSGFWCTVLTEALISLKLGKIGPKLLLMTSSLVPYALSVVPKLMTVKGHYALCCAKLPSFGAKDKNLNEDRPIPKNVGQ